MPACDMGQTGPSHKPRCSPRARTDGGGDADVHAAGQGGGEPVAGQLLRAAGGEGALVHGPKPGRLAQYTC